MEKELFTKECPICGTTFKTYNDTKKYCCHKCTLAAASLKKEKDVQPKPKEIKKCPACGKEFESHSHRHRYCSVECRRTYTALSKSEKRKETAAKQVCAYCGKEFSADCVKKYCSDRCCHLANTPKRKIVHGKVNVSLAEVARRSRDENLSYGQFVAKYGL